MRTKLSRRFYHFITWLTLTLCAACGGGNGLNNATQSSPVNLAPTIGNQSYALNENSAVDYVVSASDRSPP